MVRGAWCLGRMTCQLGSELFELVAVSVTDITNAPIPSVFARKDFIVYPMSLAFFSLASLQCDF